MSRHRLVNKGIRNAQGLPAILLFCTSACLRMMTLRDSLLLMLLAPLGCWADTLEDSSDWNSCVNDPPSCTELQMQELSLSGTIPNSLSSLTSLTTLNLGRNQLTGTIPANVVTLTNLVKLFVFGNQLTGTIPDGFSAMTDCVLLRFENNFLTGTLPPDLGTMTKLTQMRVGRNRLSGSIPAAFAALANDTLTICDNTELCGEVPVGLQLATRWPCTDEDPVGGTNIGSECAQAGGSASALVMEYDLSSGSLAATANSDSSAPDLFDFATLCPGASKAQKFVTEPESGETALLLRENAGVGLRDAGDFVGTGQQSAYTLRVRIKFPAAKDAPALARVLRVFSGADEEGLHIVSGIPRVMPHNDDGPSPLSMYGRWASLTITTEPTTDTSVYVDGVQQASFQYANWGSSLSVMSANPHIMLFHDSGQDCNDGNTADGVYLSSVQLFNRTLSAEEVAALEDVVPLVFTTPPTTSPTAGPTAGPTQSPQAAPTNAPTSPPSDAIGCAELLAMGYSTSRVYTVAPRPGGTIPPRDVYCDQETDGGGWTLMLAYQRNSSTNVALVGDTLPTRPTSGYSHWYLAEALGLSTAASVRDVRFFCTSSGHDRVMHFKTSDALVRGIALSGNQVGNAAEHWTSGFVPLADHTANLPESTISVFVEIAGGFTEFPFYANSIHHWGIRGRASRWECDDSMSSNTNTLHQVWVRLASTAPEFYDSCLVRMKWLEISDLPSMSFAEKRTAVMDSFAQVSNYTVVDLQELDSSELWEVACTDIFDSCLVARELGSAAEVRAMDFDAKRVLLIDEYVRETSIPASQVRALDRSSLWDAACIAPPIQLDPSRATQSSNYKIYSASLAADGNNSTQFTDGSCSHTKNELSWWSIDLGGNYSIQGVAITNRMDKTSGRLNDFDIRVGMHPGYSANNEACKEGLPTPAGARQMYACDYLRGRYVSINMNQNNFLQLCEVEVYAFLLSERSALTAAPTEASTNTPTQSPTIPLTESPSRSPTLPKVPHPNSENTDVLEFWKDGLDNSIQFLLNPHHTTPEVDHSAPDGSRVSRIKVIGSNRDKAVLMAHVLKKTEISENLGEIRTEF